MNREIIFKAKRKDNGEWVEGYYRRIPCMGLHEHYIMPQNPKNRLEQYEIDSDTLCQFTGLTDKEIWENDILKNKKGDIGVVQWFEEHTAFMIWNKTKNCVCYLSENDFSKIEIIGNVFDNADLFEVE